MKQIEEDLFGDASDISSDEEGKRKLTIRDSDSEGERAKETPPKKKKAKVRRRASKCTIEQKESPVTPPAHYIT